jgi:hypothetical protein
MNGCDTGSLVHVTSGSYVEGGDSSWAVTRLHTKIGLTGYRIRDPPCYRRALYRGVGKQWIFLSDHRATKF